MELANRVGVVSRNANTDCVLLIPNGDRSHVKIAEIQPTRLTVGFDFFHGEHFCPMLWWLPMWSGVHAANS